MPEKFDIIIIGGGPIGLACALEAKKAGLGYVVLEKGPLVNSLYHYPDNMTFFSTPERLEIGGVPFVSNNPKPTRNEALEYYRRVAASCELNIRLFEEVTAVQGQAPDFRIGTAKGWYDCRFIIISTGFYGIPYKLNVPGEDLPKVTHYYKNPHYYAFQKVLVVGAMNSAVDAALETFRKGAEVTMVIRSAEIGRRVKYWVRPDIDNRIKEGSVKAYFNSTVAGIKPQEVIINTPGGTVTIPNDWVIALTGYQPDLQFLRNIDIHLSEDDILKPSYSADSFETNITGIYLAGVICGGMDTHSLFIENSRVHATLIMKDIMGKAARLV